MVGQFPLESQVRSVFPLHDLVVGVQLPLQALPWQTYEQGVPLIGHLPLLQVRRLFPLHFC